MAVNVSLLVIVSKRLPTASFRSPLAHVAQASLLLLDFSQEYIASSVSSPSPRVPTTFPIDTTQIPYHGLYNPPGSYHIARTPVLVHCDSSFLSIPAQSPFDRLSIPLRFDSIRSGR